MMTKFIEILKEQLKSELPGEKAHKIMAPNTRFTGSVMPDKEIAKASAVLILIYPKNGSLHIPFILRPEYDGAHSGQVSLPGGKAEPNDPDISYTALRETYEEIGIDISRMNLLGRLSEIYIPNSNFVVHPFIGYLSQTPTFTPDPFEVQSVIEADLYDLLQPETVSVFEKEKNGHHIIAPYFNIENNKIWGATAMIISEFKEVIANSGYNITPSDFYNARNVQESH